MSETSSTPKIIYIASSWRSGSTLLDQVLGTSPNAIGTGELKSLERFVSNPELRDDSGHTPHESLLWAPFAHDISTYVPPKEEQKVAFTTGERLRLMLTGRAPVIPHRYKNIKLYTKLLEQARQVTGKEIEYIIDSSKPLYRIVELKERTNFELFVIHIVRDVRGVVYSHQKQMTKVSTRQAVYSWLVTNLGVARYLKKNMEPGSYLRIHYEAFIADPEAHIRRINKCTGLQVDANSIIEAINQEPSYRFSGNKIRKGTFTGFYENTKWKTGLPVVYRILLSPLNLLFR